MENREKSPKKQKIKLNKSQHAAYFMPMLEGFAERDMLNEVIKNRVVKACDLLDAGVPLFPNDFRKEHAVSWVLDNFGSLSAEELRFHPYIRQWRTAKAIVLYRDSTPREKWSVSALSEEGILDEVTAGKLARCVIAPP